MDDENDYGFEPLMADSDGDKKTFSDISPLKNFLQ